jgi:hypothetical protein
LFHSQASAAGGENKFPYRPLFPYLLHAIAVLVRVWALEKCYIFVA